MADWLDARAERCYARHPHFRRLVRRPGDTGRDTLHRFFRHWLASRLVRERLVSLRRLPKEYCFGGAGPVAPRAPAGATSANAACVFPPLTRCSSPGLAKSNP